MSICGNVGLDERNAVAPSSLNASLNSCVATNPSTSRQVSSRGVGFMLSLKNSDALTTDGAACRVCLLAQLFDGQISISGVFLGSLLNGPRSLLLIKSCLHFRRSVFEQGDHGAGYDLTSTANCSRGF